MDDVILMEAYKRMERAYFISEDKKMIYILALIKVSKIVARVGRIKDINEANDIIKEVTKYDTENRSLT